MKRIKYISIAALSVLVFSLFLSGCSKKETSPQTKEDEHAEETEHSEVVRLSQEELDEFGIELATAGPGELKVHVTLPGEIIIPPDNLAHIHPRFPGMVKKVYKHIGDRVKKGETLAIIEGNEALTEYEVKSLIDGTIVEKHLTLGEVVTDDNHGFVVANINTVWAILKLYQKDLPYVKVGQKVRITAGPQLPKTIAKISYISPIIDEETRTAEARVVLDNRKGYWKPGLFVNGIISTSDVQVDVLIPKTALEFFEDNKVIFVKTDEGFVPRPVQTGRENEVSIEIKSGLKAGEVYVAKGGFTMKAELQKGEMGEGHGH